MAAAYSIRPTPDARVSTPLYWEELKTANPLDFRVRTVPARLRDSGDAHRGMDEAASDLTETLALAAQHEKEGLGSPEGGSSPRKLKRASPSRRRSNMPLLEIGRAKRAVDALEGLERWKSRHPSVVPYLEPTDILVDRMRGRHSEWTRIRVNLKNVPVLERPSQEPLDPDYDVASEWSQAK